MTSRERELIRMLAEAVGQTDPVEEPKEAHPEQEPSQAVQKAMSRFWAKSADRYRSELDQAQASARAWQEKALETEEREVRRKGAPLAYATLSYGQAIAEARREEREEAAKVALECDWLSGSPDGKYSSLRETIAAAIRNRDPRP